MASTAAVLNIIVSANTAQAQGALARVDRQLKGTAASGAAANKGLARFGVTGKQVAAGGLAAVAFGAYKAVKASVDFEDAFSNVRKTVEGSDAQLDKIAMGLREMSREIPVSVGELANLAAQAGALGVPTRDLLRFTRTAALLGVTTDMSAEDAANGLARIGNVMGNTGKDFDRMAATLVDLGNKGASTEGEITEMALRFVGVAKQVGLSTDEVLGFSAALANVGEEAEAGGSAISRSFIEMGNAVGEGGEKLNAFAKVSGVSAQAFAQEFSKTPAQAMVRFVTGLSKIRKEGGNVFQTLDKLGLGEIRVRRAMLALAGSPKKLAQALGISEKAWKEMTAAEDEANRKFDTTKAKLQLLKNAVNDLGIEIGDDLRPAVDKGVQGLTDGLNTINDLDLDWSGIFDKALKTINPAAYGQDIARKVRDAVKAGGQDFAQLGQIARKGATFTLKVGGDAVGRAKAVWSAVKNVVSKAVSFVFPMDGGAMRAARALWGKIKGIMAKPIEIAVKMGEGIISRAQGVWDTINSIFSRPIEQEIHLRRVGPQGSGGGGSFASGGRNLREQIGVVGERGQELMRHANGGWSLLGQRGPHLAAIPQGADIFTANETRKLLGLGIPGFAKGKKGKKPKAKATGNPYEAALAAAELTSSLGDDINAVNALIGYWQRQAAKYAKPVRMAGKRGKAMDWSKLTEARQQIKFYTDMLAELSGASGGSAGSDSQLAELYKALATTNAQRFAVSEAQFSVLKGGLPPFAGSFATGGIVPGPIGQPQAAVVHGGESIIPASGRMEFVITNWQDGTGYLRSIAGEEAGKQGRRATRGVNRTPGNAGVL